MDRKEQPGWVGVTTESYSKSSGTITIPIFTEGTGTKDMDATELGSAQGAGRLQRRSSVAGTGINSINLDGA